MLRCFHVAYSSGYRVGKIMRTFLYALVFLGSTLVPQAKAFYSTPSTTFVRRTNAQALRTHHLVTVPGGRATMSFKNPFDALKQGIARAGAGSYDKEMLVGEMERYKADNKVVVFSWTRCPFCKKAKGLVQDLLEDPSDYKFVELDTMPDGNAMRYELSQMTGRTSVPQIWIGGEYIGGCNDGPGIFTLEEKGQLKPKLEAAGCRLKTT